MLRRVSVGALCALVAFAMVEPLGPVSAASGDKQLARIKGIVGYQDKVDGPFKPIFGRLDLADNAFAVTRPNSQALLRLRDSSEVEIGEKTLVAVGAFNAAQTGKDNTIVLEHGALHFSIHRPQGGQSNYRFTTPTSQIAVRGTEGFLVAGPQGTQVVCVACAAGDVTVTTGTQTVTIVTGQTVTVVGSSAANATVSVASNTTVNNPAVNQFNNGSNPLSSGGPTGPTAPTNVTPPTDPTGSLSGVGSGATSAGLGTVGTVGAVAGTGAVATTVAGNKGTSSSTPPPTPTPTPTPITPAPRFAATASTHQSPRDLCRT